MGRAVSTISREIARNGGRDTHRAVGADQVAYQRARRPEAPKPTRDPKLCAIVGRQAHPERAGKAEQLRTLPKLRSAAWHVASAVEILMDAPQATEDRLVSLAEVWKRSNGWCRARS
nr:hypothetical protein [Actinomadura sp. RB99]